MKSAPQIVCIFASARPLEGYEYDPYASVLVIQVGTNGLVGFDANDDHTTAMDAVSPFLYTGRRFDAETGFLYFRTRYYDEEMGRFISRDTIGVWGDPNSLGNGFAYCGSGPVECIDPTGEICWKKIFRKGFFGKCGRRTIDCEDGCWSVSVQGGKGVSGEMVLCFNRHGDTAATVGVGIGGGAATTIRWEPSCNAEGLKLSARGSCGWHGAGLASEVGTSKNSWSVMFGPAELTMAEDGLAGGASDGGSANGCAVGIMISVTVIVKDHKERNIEKCIMADYPVGDRIERRKTCESYAIDGTWRQ